MSDRWAEWVLSRRFAGDEAVRRWQLEGLAGIRDRVLDHAGLNPGETLLDIGCGDGMIGFGAIERGVGRVLFSDISRDLVQACRLAASDLRVEERCRVVRAAAECLPLADAVVDVAVVRSVLIYVAEKQRALREMARVLRPGGRLSLFEPINRLANPLDTYDLKPVADLADRVRNVFETLQPPAGDPMLDFDERDLVDLAEEAGFAVVHLELRVDVSTPPPVPWETFLRMVGNPKIPSYGEAMDQVLSPAERERLAAHLRPLVVSGRGRQRSAVAFLWARKD